MNSLLLFRSKNVPKIESMKIGVIHKEDRVYCLAAIKSISGVSLLFDVHQNGFQMALVAFLVTAIHLEVQTLRLFTII